MSFWQKFTANDLLFIAILSSMGLAIKPIVTPFVHLLSVPLLIPGGSLAGGLYMLWICLAIGIVHKPGTGILVGIVQAIAVLALGFFGNHGAVSLISYSFPGFLAEIISYLFKNKQSLAAQASMCVFANVGGTVVVTILVMRLPAIPLLIAMISSVLSGLVGGIISFSLLKKLKKFHLVKDVV